jgi:hypothetical protein
VTALLCKWEKFNIPDPMREGSEEDPTLYKMVEDFVQQDEQMGSFPPIPKFKE